MTKTLAIGGISIAVAMVAGAVVFIPSQLAEAANPVLDFLMIVIDPKLDAILNAIGSHPNERVSVTVHFSHGLPPGPLPAPTVLLDTTGSGTLKDVHVAATLPCALAPTAVVAGVAPALPIVIIPPGSAPAVPAGPDGLCVFHGSSLGNPPGAITDVVLSAPAGLPPSGVTVTVTATYN